MQPEGILVQALKLSVKELYGVEPDDILIQVQKTNRDFEGDFTIVVFPILRISNKNQKIQPTRLAIILRITTLR